MSNNIYNQKTTFWNFLKNNKIEIPIIQRDYAQGRLGKEYLRKRFLANIKQSLDGELPNKEKFLKLDFVYGAKENGFFKPLDGQQRLTTLWLLHWYIALKASEIYAASKVLKNFSYETRVSSREFCNELCIPENFDVFKIKHGEKIVDYIKNQTWFYSSWKQDPTIQSMLRMLEGTKINDKSGQDITDGLEELFQGIDESMFKYYWSLLTSNDAPIVFYHFPLKDFGLSDDLYIKMNARGKQLTPFENFKADLIGYIRNELDQSDETTKEKWKILLDSKEGIPILMDTIWTNIFWENRSKGIIDENNMIQKTNQIDEIFFAFFNRFFWNELFISKDEKNAYILRVGDGILEDGTNTSSIENYNPSYRHLNEDKYDIYSDFSPYKYLNGGVIPISLFNNLKIVLENWYKFRHQFNKTNCESISEFLMRPWDTSFHFIPIYEKDKDNEYNLEFENKSKERILKISSLNQVERIVFFAVYKYFKEGEPEVNSLKSWMRVVWNLVSGEDEEGRPQIRNAQAIRTAIEFINQKQLKSHSAYESLKSLNITGNSDYDKRCREEIEKAKQIIDENGHLKPYDGSLDEFKGKTWEDVITKAENYAFFKGSIRFLFQDANGNPDWKDFDKKWVNAKKYFAERKNNRKSIMNNNYDNATLLKALISRFLSQNYWDVLNYSHRTFNNKPETWMYYLLNDKIYGPIHDIMMGNSEIKELKKSSEEANNRLYQLSNTYLLDFVIDKIPNSWIRDYHGHRAIFPSSTGIFLDAETRDKLLTNTTGIECKVDHLVENTNFLYGSDINFKYGDYFFQWYGNPDEKELDVYLMKDNWTEYLKRPNPVNDKGTDEDTHYCFKVEEGTDSQAFLDSLNKLIEDLKSSS